MKRVNRRTRQNITAYDELASAYDSLMQQSLFYANQTRFEKELIVDSVPVARHRERAIDLGCGTGDQTLLLLQRGYSVRAVDASSSMLNELERKCRPFRARLTTELRDISTLAGHDQYSVALCIGSVLNHLEDWPSFFLGVQRHVRRGGLFIFTFDNMLGLDTITWMTASRHFSYLVTRIRHMLRGEYDVNHWPLITKERAFELNLRYHSTAQTVRWLEEAGFALSRPPVAANLLPSLLPSVVESAAYLDRTRPNPTLFKLACRIDRVLSRRLSGLGANIGIVARRVG